MTKRRGCPIGTYKRLPRGKKKHHDDFKDWTYHAFTWLRENWKIAVEIAAVAAVAVTVVLGASAYGRHRTQAAATAFFAAEDLKGDPASYQAKLLEIVGSYSRTFAGKDAMMQLGKIYAEQEQYDQAIEQFRTLADISRNKPMLRIAALHELGKVELMSGKPADAAQTFQKAAADPHNQVALTSDLFAAGCLERAGEYAGAEKLYRRILKDAGENDGAVRAMSEERLLWLTSRGHISG